MTISRKRKSRTIRGPPVEIFQRDLVAKALVLVNPTEEEIF